MKRHLRFGNSTFTIVRQNDLKVEVKDSDGDRFIILKSRLGKGSFVE